MKKITLKNQQKITGGSGVSGALITGISNLFNPIGALIGSIVTAIHSFTDDPHVKANYKYGTADMSYDDTKSYELQEEVLKRDYHLVKVTPKITEAVGVREFESEFDLTNEISVTFAELHELI